MKAILQIMASVGAHIGHWFDKQPQSSSYQHILIFQAGGIGDIVRIFPVIQSLRNQFPNAHIASLSPFAESVYSLLPEASTPDQSISYEPLKQHKGLSSKLRLAWSLRKQRFDLIINPARGEGMIEHAILCFLMGTAIRVGFEKNGAGFLNSVKVPLQDQIAITQQNLNLLTAIGVKPTVRKINLQVTGANHAFAQSLIQQYRTSPKHRLIAVQPGNHWRQELRWPAERYAELMQLLTQNHSCTILLLGTAVEADLNQWLLKKLTSKHAVDLAGQTNLNQMVAILACCDLFIGNDSGPLHLALALETPAIGIFGYTRPTQVIAATGPCIALHKAPPDSWFLHQPFAEFNPDAHNPIEYVQVSDVLQAANDLLNPHS